MGFLERAKTRAKYEVSKITYYGDKYGKDIDRGVSSSLKYGIKVSKDTPTGGSSITKNIKTALIKTDSPFKKGDYKNPFMKEE